MIEIRNIYEVSKQQRKKRSPSAKNTFNYLVWFGETGYKDGLFHPDMNIPLEHFSAITGNMAFMAADFIDKHLTDYPHIKG